MRLSLLARLSFVAVVPSLAACGFAANAASSPDPVPNPSAWDRTWVCVLVDDPHLYVSP